MILSMSEQKDLLESLIKDLDNLTDLVAVNGIQHLMDAKLQAHMLKTTFVIEERLYEDEISEQRY